MNNKCNQVDAYVRSEITANNFASGLKETFSCNDSTHDITW